MAVIEPEIGTYEFQDINERISRLLKDLGNPQPPLRLEDVRALQKLDLTYYSKSDLDLLDEIAHRTKLAGKTIATSARRMRQVVEEFGIRGLLMLNEGDKRIFIDNEVVPLKRRFVIAHEITHDLLDWHRALLLGDNESTLSPTCHQTMEAEANYGARRLIFMGDRFRQEARDLPFNWSTIDQLKTTYGNTLTTTMWHMVCERDTTMPAFGLISKHPYHSDLCSKAGPSNVAYFPRSNALIRQFPDLSEHVAYNAIVAHATQKKAGRVGEGESIFLDGNGDPHIFKIFSFSNTYDLLSYGIYHAPHTPVY